MFTAGQHFKDYSIERMLGESRLAFTFLAEGPGGQRVVIKVFKDEIFTRDEGFGQLMHPRNAIVSGAVTNRSHLSFYRVVASEEITPGELRAYLVREYVEGESLDDWRKSPRTWAEILAVLRKICEGLRHLHEAGLVHGGLSPQNVILDVNPEARREVLKITDFGTGASVLGHLPGLDDKFESEKSPFVPPWWDRPDQFETPATDIYALGVILFLLQRGMLPEGVPEDAAAPVQEALRGEYLKVEDFWADVESLNMDGESKGGEEQEEGRDEHAESEDAEGESAGQEEEGSTGTAPEVGPQVEIEGDGILREPSGLIYRLEKQFNETERLSFVLRNLDEEGRALTVKAVVILGSNRMRVEPTEISVPPGKQEFQIIPSTLPFQGKLEGQVTLEINFNESLARITRDILVCAEFKPLEHPQPAWWKWVAVPAASIALAAFIYFQFNTGFVPGKQESPGILPQTQEATRVREPDTKSSNNQQPTSAQPTEPALNPPSTETPITNPAFAESPSATEHSELPRQLTSVAPSAGVSPEAITPEKPPSSSGALPAQSSVPQEVPDLPPAHPERPPVADLSIQITRIRDNLLAKGEYQDAARELNDLNALNPGNKEVESLLGQLSKGLTVPSELIPSPGQGKVREGMITISSGGGFKLRFTPSDTCYLYIFQLDSQSKLDRLFPAAKAMTGDKPVQGGKAYLIPAGKQDYFVLDRNTGRETVYLVASRWPAMDLREPYEQLVKASEPAEQNRYREQLIAQLNARREECAEGVGGCFYREHVFSHR